MFKSMISIAVAGTLVSSLAFGKDLALSPEKSSIAWEGSKVVGGSHNGTIGLAEGSLKLDKEKVIGGEIVIDMKSIVNEDLSDPKWNKKLVDHLKSEDFFKVESYPKATFKFDKVVAKSGDVHVLTGKMTIRGVTKDMSTEATIKKESNRFKLVSDFSIDRTLFEVRYGSGKFFENLGDKMISDNFTIKATIVSEPIANKQTSR